MLAQSKSALETPKIAIVVTSGCDGESTLRIKEALSAEGAVPRLVGITSGRASSINSPSLDIDMSMEAAASDTWDAMVIPNGEAAIEILLDSDKAQAFLKDQYRHRKPILLLGKAQSLLDVAGISPTLSNGAEDPRLLVYPGNDTSAAISAFIDKLAMTRQRERAQV
jgi:catalase